MTGTMPPVMAYFWDRPSGLSFFLGIISFISRSRKKNSLLLPEEEGALNKENIKTSKMMFLLILLHFFNHF